MCFPKSPKSLPPQLIQTIRQRQELAKPKILPRKRDTKMPFPTKPCFAYHPKGWDDAVLQHPAMAFMHRFTHEWCETKAAHSQPFSDWYAPGYELGSHDGRRFTGDMAAKAFVKSVELYSSSTVEISACYLEETEDGYTGVATGMIYANFVVPGEKTCKDSQGREWELCVSGIADDGWNDD